YISEAPLLRALPAGIFEGLTNSFLSLRIMRTGLENFPDLSDLSEGSIMHMIDLEANRIHEIKSNSVRVKAYQLILNYNAIQTVEGWAFNGSEIAKLSLKGNRLLTRLSNEAFHGLKSLTDLDLSETAITHLPTGGLGGLEVLRIQDTESLKVFPSVYSFKHLKEAWLTYSFHCCAFKFPARHDPTKHAMHQAYLSKMRENCSKDTGQRNKRSTSHTMWTGSLSEFIHTSSEYIPTLSYNDIWGPSYEDGRSFGPISAEGYQPPVDSTQYSDQSASDGQQWHSEAEPVNVEADSDDPNVDHGTFHQTTAEVATKLQAMCGNLSVSPIHVMCRPAPDALNPCEDIMGFTWLRVSVWFVVVTAVVGNLAVLLVLLSNMLDLTVPKFLMCHLAFADLCMGAYLLILAVMDVHSSGVYFNFAYGWQIGVGCQVAGFLTVFASQLSIYTLCILTLERWFAITYAIYLNKRLKLRAAAHIMAGGWVYSVTMAALPLFGISSYSTTREVCKEMLTSGACLTKSTCFSVVAKLLLKLVVQSREQPGVSAVENLSAHSSTQPALSVGYVVARDGLYRAFIILKPSFSPVTNLWLFCQHLPANGDKRCDGRGISNLPAGCERTGVCRYLHLLRTNLPVTGTRDAQVLQCWALQCLFHRRNDCCQKDGATRLHRLRLLGAHRFLWADGCRRLSSHRRHSLQDSPCFLLPSQFLRKSLSVRHTHGTVQEGSLCASGKAQVAQESEPSDPKKEGIVILLKVSNHLGLEPARLYRSLDSSGMALVQKRYLKVRYVVQKQPQSRHMNDI
ncbi:hypothetical protein Cfor_09362, partial [Coptotermes formosanus]